MKNSEPDYFKFVRQSNLKKHDFKEDPWLTRNWPLILCLVLLIALLTSIVLGVSAIVR